MQALPFQKASFPATPDASALWRSARTAVLWIVLCAPLLLAGPTAQAHPSSSPCLALHVNGQAWVVQPADTVQVELEHPLQPEDTLLFGSSEDYVVALCPSEGRIVLRPDPEALRRVGRSSRSSKPPLLVMVRQALTRPDAPVPLSTRGDGRGPGNPVERLNDLEDVRRHFGVPRYLVIDSVAVPVDAEGPLAEALHHGATLALRAGPDAASVPFILRKDHLLLSAATLRPLVPPGEPFLAELHFLAPSASEGQLLTEVLLIRPSPLQLQRQVELLVRMLRRQGQSSKETLRQETAAFLEDTYAVPYLPHLDALITRSAE